MFTNILKPFGAALRFDNFATVLGAVNMGRYLVNTAIVAIGVPQNQANLPSTLYPRFFNARVGGHEMWGAIRGAELGDGTVEARSIPHTLQAIDLLTHDSDVLELFCDRIVKNKSIGIYDGAYRCVELATGRRFERATHPK